MFGDKSCLKGDTDFRFRQICLLSFVVGNELQITAEIHSFAEDYPSPVMAGADLSPQYSSDNRLPVHGVPSEEDEWSRRLDELDNDTVDMDDCPGDSLSRRPTIIDIGDVRIGSVVTSKARDVDAVRSDGIDECEITNRSSVTSHPCSVKRDDNAVRRDADYNCEKTKEEQGQRNAGNVCDGPVEPKAIQIRNWNRNDAYDFSAIETGSPEVDVRHAQSNTSASQPDTEHASHKNRVAEAVLPGIELAALERKDMTRAGELNQLEELLESIFTPTPVELLKVVLYKVRSSDDFGFSLSDGVYEKGVYVSGVKPGGPASEGLLPYDKILQVKIPNLL